MSLDEPTEPVSRGVPVEDLAGTVVELDSNLRKPMGAVHVQVAPFGEIIAEQWSGPRKLDTLMEAYAMEGVWARYSSGLR